jgi:ABC-type uncharacterized transport system ATPase subunit
MTQMIICNRVILINHGEKLIDTSLHDMRHRYLKKKKLRFVTAEEHPVITLPEGALISYEPFALTVEIDPDVLVLSEIVTTIMSSLTVHDMSIHDRELEDVIRMIYSEET